MPLGRPLVLCFACALPMCGAACAVSFDGYMLDEADASHGQAGSSSGGRSGASGAGAVGARGGTAGKSEDASSSGSSGLGGSSGGGQGGAAAGAGGASGMGGTLGTSGGGGNAGNSAGAGGSSGGAGKSGSAGSAGNAGSAGSAGSAGTFSCPVGLPGPPLQPIPKPGGGFYCIDQSEVTNQQYGAFLSTNPSPAQQPSFCSWNTSFVPATGPNCPSPLPYEPVGKGPYPVSCVDWCDAYAYCRAAQKRLCGRIGGGAIAPAAIADAAQSQWYNACSLGGTRRYPYSSQYDGTRCNGLDYTASGSVPVASLSLCQGGYPNVYDMSGNVREWEDGCAATSGQSDGCPQRGGGYLDDDNQPPETLECSNGPLAPRNMRDRLLGFRCCTDG